VLKWKSKSNDKSHNVEQAPQQPASELEVAPTGSNGSGTKKPVTSVKSGQLISHTVTPKLIAANQKKAQKSTGPTTAKGKTNSSWNSSKHGLLSKRLKLKDQEAKEFAHILASLRQDLQPVGTLEEMLVEKIAYIYFRIAAAAKYEDDNHLTLLSMPAGSNLTRYQTMLSRQFYHAINQLERLQRQRQGENVPAPLSVQVLHEVAGDGGDQKNSE
jgi:hypothetical protein